MKRYSAWALLKEGLGGHRGWEPAWRMPEPKSRYRVVIIGGGGHGLATAYYLARNHGISDVAVIEKGWLGGGNTGRNTTVVRSNYYYPQSAALYDFALKLYEGLSKDLNYNIMLSQRGQINLAHSRHDLEIMARLAAAMECNGVAARLMTPAEIKQRAPVLDMSPNARFPIWGGFMQDRGGTARHDAVAWGYARAASGRGVDIIQNCEVKAIRRAADGRVTGISTTRGEIACDTLVSSVAGHSTVIADMAGFRLPVTSYALQAFVSEPIKPVLDTVLISWATGLYISQSDKGGLVAGSALDLYPSYAQRGNLPVTIGTARAIAEQMPSLARVKLVRQWAGIVDVVHDSSPILGATPVPNLLINCGWGTGGFKAIPVGGWVMAHHAATGQPHELARPFALSRFTTGALVDEGAASGIAH